MSDQDADLDQLLAGLARAGFAAGDYLGIVAAPGTGVGLAAGGERWTLSSADPVDGLRHLEDVYRPRWTWWSAETPAALVRFGLRIARCWDVASVHRLLFGGVRAEPGRVWAALHDLRGDAVPSLGQLDLLGQHGDDSGDPEEPVGPDGHLRPEWTGGGWSRSARRSARWAEVALAAAEAQRQRLAALPTGGDALLTAWSESAADLLCCELETDGLPIDRQQAEQLIAAAIGQRAPDAAAATALRSQRDEAVLQHVRGSEQVDLRNPAQVRAMLLRAGFDVPDTRSWRLEPFLGAHPVIEALLAWRKADRIGSTYGYNWLDSQVSPDGRLRGAWSGSDGAAGRMTAQAGLHNLPAELRPAVVAETGHVFVRADLGQIEPRILAAVSQDVGLIAASADDDLYAPIAARLKVDRSVAKVAVLAAMYGQTSGVAGEALRGLESAYPTAMRYLRDANDSGRAGRDVRTYGGRLVRIGPLPLDLDEDQELLATGRRGRYARNAVVQGAAAEFFKSWAVTVRARIAAADARIVLCLHDEILVHTPSEQAQTVSQLVRDCLSETARRWVRQQPVRFVVDLVVVQRWSEAKVAEVPARI